MRRPLLLAVLPILALPGLAHAAPAKISPRGPVVSAAGAVSVEVANPNAHVLRGTATVRIGARTLATKRVRLGTRSVTELRLRLSATALAALRSARGRATVTLAVRGSGGRRTSVRRTLTFRLPAAAPSAPGEAPQTPAPSAPAGTPPGPSVPSAPTTGTPATGTPTRPPASGRWLGRMGTEGPHDDFELTVAGGQLQMTSPPSVPVVCFENGGAYRSALSFEIFDALGPWPIGTDTDIAKQGIAVNQLVHSGARSMTYKVTGSSQEPGRVAGTLGMSFADSKYDVFTNRITFVNCSGSQSFEAVRAG